MSASFTKRHSDSEWISILQSKFKSREMECSIVVVDFGKGNEQMTVFTVDKDLRIQLFDSKQIIRDLNLNIPKQALRIQRILREGADDEVPDKCVPTWYGHDRPT
jgi:hypothetical protein